VPSEKRARQRAAREAKLAAQAKVDRRRRSIRSGIIVAVIAIIVVGSIFLITHHSSPPAKSATTTTTAKSTTTTSSTTTTTAPPTANAKLQAAANATAVAAGCPASTATRVNNQTYSAPPPMTTNTKATYTATVVTTAGTFVITLDAATAPQTVNNFIFLADKGFYHCVIFHRVIPNFMDQTGDPTGTGTGGPGYTIPDEYPAAASNPAEQYPVGSVAMANSGSPDTGGSQWFIVLGPQGESLPNTYSLFGQVTSGLAVAQTINQEGNSSASSNGVPPDVVQRILSITIAES
jgi:peptidyl-prolyl cis-trans isomerase B (cyclophilin B)